MVFWPVTLRNPSGRLVPHPGFAELNRVSSMIAKTRRELFPAQRQKDEVAHAQSERARMREDLERFFAANPLLAQPHNKQAWEELISENLFKLRRGEIRWGDGY